MFLLKKLVTPFMLPPGLLILMLILSGVIFFFGRRRKIGAFNLSIGLLFWICCTAPFSNLLMRGLESEFSIPKDVKGDVLLLLGGGMIDGVPDFSGYGVPTDRMLGRIVTAVRLQKRLNIPLIISGGNAITNNSSEAAVARRIMVDLGVAEDRIIIEEKSRDTYENARHIQELCQKRDYVSPILITSASHMKRSLMTFKKIGLNVRPYPASFKTRDTGIRDYSWLDYLPRATSLANTSTAVHEYIGIFFYTKVY